MPKCSRYCSRNFELMPSASTTRSWSRTSGAMSSTSRPSTNLTPSSSARSWRMRRRVRRAQPQKPLPPIRCRGALEVDLDVVPVDELVGDRRVALRVVALEIVERLVGEDDAEAEGVADQVPLVDGDVDERRRLLHQDREIEPGGSGADDRHGPERARHVSSPNCFKPKVSCYAGPAGLVTPAPPRWSRSRPARAGSTRRATSTTAIGG